ncbi:MAG: sel1 repeat family protein [Campylobacteraceae bacterium]|jgi:TPR repeat protein|nr:sel1 repeat family protein [Campylobacteraceae bacterium]
MSKKRRIFWIATLTVTILIAYLNFFYFGFENTHKRECNNGNMTSCYDLGFAYHNGINEVKKDTLKALKYIQKACDNKYVQSCKYLGDIADNLNDSIKYYDLACNYKLPDSCYAIGLLYMNETMKNLSKSFSYFKDLCAKDYKDSCYHVALIHAQHDAPVDIRNYKKALSMFDELCNKNDYAACYRAGWAYYDNANNYDMEGVVDVADPMSYFTKSCEGGYIYGCYTIDMHKQELKQLEENQKLCDNGSAEHCNKAAYTYRRGRTIQKNLTKAIQYYSKACDEYDDIKACKEAHYAYNQYDLVNKMKSALKACDKGAYDLCINAGRLYLHVYEHDLNYRLVYLQNPDILPKDMQKALYYYKKAYENGIDDGYYKTGLTYYREKEVRDLKLAEKYLKISCDKNDKHGCFYLSYTYEDMNDMQNALLYAKKGCDLDSTNPCRQYERLEKKLNNK